MSRPKVVHIGINIRKTRKLAGLSQMKLAELIDVSYQQLQKYESGYSQLSIIKLSDIAEALGVPIMQLLDNAENDNSPCIISSYELQVLYLFRDIRDEAIREMAVNILRRFIEIERMV